MPTTPAPAAPRRHLAPVPSSRQPGRKTPAAGRETPAAGRETPAAGRETPAAGRETPAAGRETPAAPRVLDPASLTRHLDRLYRAALSMSGSRADAEDLVQEVCLRALSKPRLVRGADDLPYLLQMLRNVFYNQCRSRATRRTTPVEPESLTAIPDGRRHDPELGTLVRDVHRAIAELPQHYREAVVAVDVLGLPYADAAEALGVPVGTVMSRLYRGRVGVARSVGHEPAAA